MPFFSWSWVVLLLFFFFSHLPFFFLLGLRCSSFFGAGHFPFSFWGVPNLFFLFLVFFFSWSWVVLLLFFLFFSHLPFFFFWGCAVLLLFSVLDIFLFLSGGCRICSSCFWSLFLVSYFLGLAFSLSLSPSIAWTSRSEIDSSLFLAASLIIFVEPW